MLLAGLVRKKMQIGVHFVTDLWTGHILISVFENLWHSPACHLPMFMELLYHCFWPMPTFAMSVATTLSLDLQDL